MTATIHARPTSRAARAAREASHHVRDGAPAAALIIVGTMVVVAIAVDEPMALLVPVGVGCVVLALAFGWAERFVVELVFPTNPSDDTPPRR